MGNDNSVSTIIKTCKLYQRKCTRYQIQLFSNTVISSPWKAQWNWTAFSQNSFVILPGLLYHLIRRDSGRLANETFESCPIVSLKQQLNGSKIVNWIMSPAIPNDIFASSAIPWNLHSSVSSKMQNVQSLLKLYLLRTKNLELRTTWKKDSLCDLVF